MATSNNRLEQPSFPTSRIPVDAGQLGDAVDAWIGAKDVPPLFIEAKADAFPDVPSAIEWVGAHREALDALILEHGGIVLRGLPIESAADFNALVHNFPLYKPGYVAGMSPRKKVKEDVLESTRLDKNFKIQLHSEMAYMKQYPPRIAFFCRTAAPIGGETIIGKMSEFMKRLPADLAAKLDSHDYHVVRNYAPAGNTRDAAEVSHGDQVGWDEAFFADSREEVEERCRELGMEPSWNDDGSLTLVEISKPFTVHPKTGERFYRANLHVNNAYEDGGLAEIQAKVRASQKRPTGHYLGNGEMLSRDESNRITSIFQEIELAWPWQDGDVMILDNLQVVHGRNPFDGPREVMVALLDH
ncbi:TauD/TfdA family dioxygenase [Rhizorhabdus sp.]|uniref:TauD/TfdA family dioxygenase n=1 Tax=Rhizorhabdus sp. TaxID=1968843 RepID=UPI00198CA455|nr:TauD/TfdA family dioxygenase [Rhizorhabdus sp.]MBD3759629.1 TauD/TfdA family dioxygenase [Rhizorhabdus sp.]